MSQNDNKENIDRIFCEYELPIPIMVYNLAHEKQDEIINYIKSMDERDKKAYRIALNHLGTSFNICKSNGYKDWKKAQSK
jgi:plasmid replication initiation protein